MQVLSFSLPLVCLKVIDRNIHSLSLLQRCHGFQQDVVIVRVWGVKVPITEEEKKGGKREKKKDVSSLSPLKVSCLLLPM